MLRSPLLLRLAGRRGRHVENLIYVLPSQGQQTGMPATTRVRLRFGHRAPLSTDLVASDRPTYDYTLVPLFHLPGWRCRGAIVDCGRIGSAELARWYSGSRQLLIREKRRA